VRYFPVEVAADIPLNLSEIPLIINGIGCLKVTKKLLTPFPIPACRGSLSIFKKVEIYELNF
tara:strand:- start:681 stop:866 length:186 start_codon:yes stop_codon:yes gene_type:complete